MTRLSLAALALAVVLVRPVGTQSAALADARIALGGDAALAGITSIHASGKLQVPGTYSGHVDVYVESPDKFARITRLPSPPPQNTSYGRVQYSDAGSPDLLSPQRTLPDLNVGDSRTTRVGFNGATALRPEHGVSSYESMLGGGPRQYARFAIPLLTRTAPPYRTDPTSGIDAVEFAGDDGTTWRLVLDRATHLPSALKWTQVRPTRSNGQRPPDAEWTMTFGDYRKVGGVTWPYRLVTKLAGETIEDVRIDKYEINKTISPKIFK